MRRFDLGIGEVAKAGRGCKSEDPVLFSNVPAEVWNRGLFAEVGDD